MKTNGPIILARYLALAWLGLLIYASLHPFSGWRNSGVSPLAFLEGGWPRYWTVFDLAANVLVYLPFGFLLTLALSRLPGRLTGAILAALLAAGISFGLECVQTWLPARVPSNIDLICNSLGGLIGAVLGHLAGPRFFPHLLRWQHRLVAPHRHVELGLTLLGLWLMIPLSPEILLFGAGDLRHLLDLPQTLPFTPHSFPLLETTIVACNVVTMGMLVRLLAANRPLAYALAATLLGAGLLVRTLAAAILIGPEHAFSWWTPGTQNGLLIGGAALIPALLLPYRLCPVLAALTLMAGTIVVNIAPVDPYSVAALAVWRQGHFLNFNGLTRLVSLLWPFLVLPYLMFATRRE